MPLTGNSVKAIDKRLHLSMKINYPALYIFTALIWGSGWIAITFQLGQVAPMISVVYRFGLAAVLLFIWCALRRIPLGLSLQEHGLLFFQGASLFGFNYWLIYIAEQYITSGVVALIFSGMVLFNALNARLFLQMAIKPRVVVGGLAGLTGMVLVFGQEVESFSFQEQAAAGLLLALAATYVASLGNIVAAHIAGKGHSVFTLNAWSMFYGSSALALVALVMGESFSFELSLEYIASLIYLSVFASVITFVAYIRLISEIGPDRAGYIGMLVPVIALIFSTLFEGYSWSLPASLGLVLILGGNWWVMRR